MAVALRLLAAVEADPTLHADTPILNEVLKVYCRALQADAAMAFFQTRFDGVGDGDVGSYADAEGQRQAEAATSSTSLRRCLPDGRTYRVLVEMFVRAGDLQGAVEIKDQMIKSKGITSSRC